jgi:hypothetical protein
MYNSFYLFDTEDLEEERINESIRSIGATTNANPGAGGVVDDHVDQTIDKVVSAIVHKIE